MRNAQWGPRGGDPKGPSRAGQGAPKLEADPSRRCKATLPPPPGSALRKAAGETRSGRSAELALDAGRGPAVLWLLLYLWIQRSSNYLYLTFTVKALLSLASSRAQGKGGGRLLSV